MPARIEAAVARPSSVSRPRPIESLSIGCGPNKQQSVEGNRGKIRFHNEC